MIAWWWSFLLAGIGVGGLFLTTREGNVRWAGYGVGLLVQGLWIAYALTTGQLGFLLSAGAYGSVNCIGLWKWWRTRNTEDDVVRYISDRFELTVPINGDPKEAWAFTERAVEALQGGLRWRGVDYFGSLAQHPAIATQVIPGGKPPPPQPNRLKLEAIGIDREGMRLLWSALDEHTDSHSLTYQPATGEP